MDADRCAGSDDEKRRMDRPTLRRRLRPRPWRLLLLCCAVTVAILPLIPGPRRPRPQHRAPQPPSFPASELAVESEAAVVSDLAIGSESAAASRQARHQQKALGEEVARLDATFDAALKRMAEVEWLQRPRRGLPEEEEEEDDDEEEEEATEAADGGSPAALGLGAPFAPTPPAPPASPAHPADSGARAHSLAGAAANPSPERRERVRAAFQHSWAGYRRFAWGHDELQPLSRRGHDWLAGPNAGLGVSLLDGMTTAWLMGLREEFEEALDWVRDHLTFDRDAAVSVFESTIRHLGALLSAYELSGERHHWLVDKAEDLGRRLLHAYNTTTGIPHATINLRTKAPSGLAWASGASALAEFGTVQLEMKTLSFHTNDPIFDRHATWVMNVLRQRLPADGLAPTLLDPTTGRWTTDHVSLGALGDSYYEYLLKQWLITDRVEDRYREMFEQAAAGVVARLVQRSPAGAVYLARAKRRLTVPRMDHLACFAGGWFALGAHTVGGPRAGEWRRLAANLTETCYHMYHRSPTGLAPEVTDFRSEGDGGGGRPAPAFYLLRPETAESLFYLWRVTREQKYRDWGWEIFQAIERWCRVPTGGFSGVVDVTVVPPQKDDLMQSFWLAETLKYFYLLFAEDDALDLSRWVLNTEAHPLKIRRRPNLHHYWEGEASPAAATAAVTDLQPARSTAAAAPVPGYILRPDVDVDGFDLPGPGAPLDLLLAAGECDRRPACRGFTVTGQLKAAVQTLVRRPGGGLYVKAAALGAQP